MKDTLRRKMPTFHLKPGLVEPKMKLGWAIANLGAAAVKRDLFRACSGEKKMGKPGRSHRAPRGARGGCSRCLGLSPAPPGQKMGPANAGEGSRRANQGVQRDFLSAALPWTMADLAGAAASHHNMHRQLWCACPPPCPLLKLPLAVQPKATLQSHGGRVLLMKAEGCDFPVGIQLKKGP